MGKNILKNELSKCIQETLVRSPIIFCEIGARHGGNRFHEIGEFVHYYGFEPDRKEAEALKKKLTDGKLFNTVRIFPQAIMGKAGRAAINILRHPGCSSVLFPNEGIISQYAIRHKPDGEITTEWPKSFELAGRYECDAISLDEFAVKEKLTSIDFIGIDTQGTEYEILAGGKNIITQSTLFINVEIASMPLYKGQSLLTDVMRLLLDFGFRLISLENPQYVSRPPAWADDAIDRGELVSIDGIFCRDIDEQFFRKSDPATIVKFMLILHYLGFKTFAIDVGRRSTAYDGSNSCIPELTAALEKQYLIDNYNAKPLRGKVREKIKNLYRQLRSYPGPQTRTLRIW
ncbi:MAG: FkbM family methyltransferase [Candidatus Sungbacteria bacterium]|nr:FkbM family methyltransferase [Candidatus Sungbacteria bacterium]